MYPRKNGHISSTYMAHHKPAPLATTSTKKTSVLIDWIVNTRHTLRASSEINERSELSFAKINLSVCNRGNTSKFPVNCGSCEEVLEIAVLTGNGTSWVMSWKASEQRSFLSIYQQYKDCLKRYKSTITGSSNIGSTSNSERFSKILNKKYKSSTILNKSKG